jgi:xanthine dehydrogenase accessory factor
MDTLERIFQLRSEGRRFAIATVVSRKAPVSSHLGDKAIILEDGMVEGFIGGACSRDIIKKQALEVLNRERPRLVRISPDPMPVQITSSHDEICVPMTCVSEGAVDVYIEPQLEKKQMLVVGASPIAIAVAKQGKLQSYDVTMVCEDAERATLAFGLEGVQVNPIDVKELGGWLESLPTLRKGLLEAVVASMGHYDEETLILLAKIKPRYLGLVASRKRGATVMEFVKEAVAKEELARVRNPAGLDISAKTPNEVAVSILAEMIQLRRMAASKGVIEALENLPMVQKQDVREPQISASSTESSNEAIDPVCGMTVDVATAKHSYELEGAMYYFCCPHCRKKFVDNPQKYLAVSS